MNPFNGEYHQTLSMYNLIQNYSSEAEVNFLEALKNDNNLIEARKGLVILYQNQNRLNESLEFIKELEAISHGMQHLNILKANQYYLQDEIESAIKYTTKESEEYPDEPDAYYLLSDLYKINGNELKSRSFLEKAEKLDGNTSYQNIYSLLNIK